MNYSRSLLQWHPREQPKSVTVREWLILCHCKQLNFIIRLEIGKSETCHCIQLALYCVTVSNFSCSKNSKVLCFGGCFPDKCKRSTENEVGGGCFICIPGPRAAEKKGLRTEERQLLPPFLHDGHPTHKGSHFNRWLHELGKMVKYIKMPLVSCHNHAGKVEYMPEL